MDDSLTLLNQAIEWRSEGHKVAVAIVTNTWGSAPRAAGSLMIIRDDEHFEGSVSGGCVEGAVITAALECLDHQETELLSFGVENESAWQVGLACGGSIEILVFFLSTVGADIIQRSIKMVDEGETIGLVYDQKSGAVEIITIGVPVKSQISETDQNQFIQVLTPAKQLIIIGAVHIAQHLIAMAQSCDFDVLVVDPRDLFASDQRFQSAKCTSDWPDVALNSLKITSKTAIVSLTHDPKLDDPALAAALKSNAFYIGALGSKKTHVARIERLRNMGFNDTQTSRIHGPIGLNIGAANPAEIAVSIISEIIFALRKPGA